MSDISKRPGSVTFVAIVLFVFGGYCLLSAAGNCWYAVHIGANPQAPDPKEKVRFDDVEANLRYVAQEIPGSIATIVTFSILDILFGSAQVACAIGVWRLAPAARKAAIALILIRFPYVLAYEIFSLLVVAPAEIRFLELHPPEIPQGDQAVVNLVITVSQVVIYAGAIFGIAIQFFALVLIVWLMNTAAAKAAFAGTPPPSPEPPPPVKPPSLYTGYEEDDTQPA